MAVREAIEKDLDRRSLSCRCSGQCSCCVSAKFLGFETGDACIKLAFSKFTSSPTKFTFDFTLGGRTVFSRSYSEIPRPLPSPCVDMGWGTKVCLNLYDVAISDGKLRGCAKVDGYVLSVGIGTVMQSVALNLLSTSLTSPQTSSPPHYNITATEWSNMSSEATPNGIDWGANVTTTSSYEYEYEYEYYYYEYVHSEEQLLWEERVKLLWKITGPIILILGTFGNAAILVVLRKILSDLSAFPLLFVALAVTDFALLYVFLLPEWIARQFEVWITAQHSALCKLLAWSEHSLRTLSAWLLAAMTTQRAVTIVWPVQIRKVKPKRQALVTIAVLVAISFLFNASVLYGKELNHGQCFWLAEFEYGPRKYIEWLELVLNSFLPSVIMAICNYLMIRAVVQSTQRSHRGSGLRNSDSSEVRKSRVTLTLIVVSLVFIALTLPYCVLLIVYMQVGDNINNQGIRFWLNFTKMLWITNSAVNFFLYILTGSRFREEGRKMLIRRSSSSRSSCNTGETGSHHVASTDF